MHMTENIIVPAKDSSLLTNYEARLCLNLATSTDDNVDDMIEMLIKWCSDEIAVQCQRTFAKETLIETFRDVNLGCKRLFVSHAPIESITGVVSGSIPLAKDVDYEVDVDGGKLTRLNATWSDPTVVSYTGGFDLPAEAPPALQQAALLMTREAYFATIRGDATVRMISHKESRIIYFDPASMLKALSSGGGGKGGGSPARRAIADLLGAFTRYEV